MQPLWRSLIYNADAILVNSKTKKETSWNVSLDQRLGYDSRDDIQCNSLSQMIAVNRLLSISRRNVFGWLNPKVRFI